MGESLIRLGRADEALPVLDEAVAALPKDAWLAGVRANALAVQAGAPPNLLVQLDVRSGRRVGDPATAAGGLQPLDRRTCF